MKQARSIDDKTCKFKTKTIMRRYHIYHSTRISYRKIIILIIEEQFNIKWEPQCKKKVLQMKKNNSYNKISKQNEEKESKIENKMRNVEREEQRLEDGKQDGKCSL